MSKLNIAIVAFALSVSSVSAAEMFTGTQAPSSGTWVKLTDKQIAARSNIKTCGNEWKAAKSSQNTKKPDGKTWPEFWSSCNARLKAGTAKTAEVSAE
jgi:hypothetical protein